MKILNFKGLNLLNKANFFKNCKANLFISPQFFTPPIIVLFQCSLENEMKTSLLLNHPVMTVIMQCMLVHLLVCDIQCNCCAVFITAWRKRWEIHCIFFFHFQLLYKKTTTSWGWAGPSSAQTGSFFYLVQDLLHQIDKTSRYVLIKWTIIPSNPTRNGWKDGKNFNS